MMTTAPVVALQVRFNEKSVRDTAFLCENVAHALDDLQPVWRAFVPELRAALRRNFDQRQGSVDGPWAALDPVYLARKVRKGLSPKILIATGAMRRAAVDSHAPGQSVVTEKQHMVFAIDMGAVSDKGFNYAYVHDVTGVKSKRGRIRREFMVLDQQAVTEGDSSLRRLVVRHVEAAKRKRARGG